MQRKLLCSIGHAVVGQPFMNLVVIHEYSVSVYKCHCFSVPMCVFDLLLVIWYHLRRYKQYVKVATKRLAYKI